jgi:3-phosphoglycerate kinase
MSRAAKQSAGAHWQVAKACVMSRACRARGF